MAYNDYKAFERFQQRVIERMMDRLSVLEPEQLVEPPPPPKSLMEQWRDGELKPGPHLPMYNVTKLPATRFACLGCGCCRELLGHYYCEQCLIGRRPYLRVKTR